MVSKKSDVVSTLLELNIPDGKQLVIKLYKYIINVELEP